MIDASGGVILLMQWPGGPAMHFFLHELATPIVQKLLSIYRALYGVPKLLRPHLAMGSKASNLGERVSGAGGVFSEYR
jgi:hypothetical protein